MPLWMKAQVWVNSLIINSLWKIEIFVRFIRTDLQRQVLPYSN